MSQQLISHSPDLKRLRDEGYEIEVKGGYLLIHHIPYLNASGEMKFGTLVTDLTLNGDITTTPSYHVIHFNGEYPCNKDGTPILAIQYIAVPQTLYSGVDIQFSFSNKPSNGYSDYYHKVSRYADIISASAKSLHPTATEKTFKVISTEAEDTPFQYLDTNTSRANIQQINNKLGGQKIAIVGLGGTGAYILDLITKSPVQEVHIFDGDVFHTHNAFRSPGAASIDQLRSQPLKVEYYANMYLNMHKRIIVHPYYVREDNVHELEMMDCTFICVDRNVARGLISDYLSMKGQTFIDAGLGVNISGGSLVGMTRVTTATRSKSQHLQTRLPVDEQGDNEYSTNIQIADLNALNAVLAVIKWKKLCGFYQDSIREHHSLYSVNVSELFNEEQDPAA